MTDTHYLALYRKYRPQTFDDVVGRDAIIRTLKNQIEYKRIGHSYLFCGTRGTGKTTIAKIFAKAVNCENPQDGNPCCECAACRAIDAEANLNVVEMDAASNNGVDDIRGIIEQVTYSPTQGKYRVFIIDEVHMLSTAAFNALLKTLEEPPSYAIFILATTEPNKLPVTILSRCQRYDFGRLPAATIAARLKDVAGRENLQVEEKALHYIASAADGSLRDGLSILDQCNAFNFGNNILTYDRTLEILGAVDTRVFSRMFRHVHNGEINDALKLLDEILNQGRELIQFVTDFIGYLRNVMLLKASEEMASSMDVSSDNLALMIEDARMSELEEDIRYINVFSALTEQIRYSASRKILTEAAIIRLCEPSMDGAGSTQDNEAKLFTLMERVRVLEDRLVKAEKALESGVRMNPAPAQNTEPVQHTAQGGQPAKKEPSLPEALPEEIEKLRDMWDSIVGSIPPDHHLVKIYLQGANPTATDDGRLLIVFENYVYAVHFIGRSNDADENRKYVEDYIAARVGRKVSIDYKLLDKGQKFTDNYKDIRRSINMTIEQE